jgi:hypothetical protein
MCAEGGHEHGCEAFVDAIAIAAAAEGGGGGGT